MTPIPYEEITSCEKAGSSPPNYINLCHHFCCSQQAPHLSPYSEWLFVVILWSETAYYNSLQTEPQCENTVFGFLTRSDTNRFLSSKKGLRNLKFWIKKKKDCTIPIAKTKVLISCAVTAQLICAFVFALAKIWLSHGGAQLSGYCYYQLKKHFKKHFTERPLHQLTTLKAQKGSKDQTGLANYSIHRSNLS